MDAGAHRLPLAGGERLLLGRSRSRPAGALRSAQGGEGQARPRTKTGVPRIVGVPPVLAKLLREHRRKLTESKHPGLASGLIFPSNVGTPLASSRISDALRAACKTAGISQRFTSHGFRRSMTDMLRKARVDPVIAAAVVGHETERMRRHYSTIDPDDARAAGEQVAARLMQPSAPRKAG
ncbi:MAG: tyrosine-type recombinase/integrase [Sandaracinaceae bacterium]|nr:tyrosine-type recombinase/integrase [Sandaracinaceae bacterium]